MICPQTPTSALLPSTSGQSRNWVRRYATWTDVQAVNDKNASSQMNWAMGQNLQSDNLMLHKAATQSGDLTVIYVEIDGTQSLVS